MIGIGSNPPHHYCLSHPSHTGECGPHPACIAHPETTKSRPRLKTFTIWVSGFRVQVSNFGNRSGSESQCVCLGGSLHGSKYVSRMFNKVGPDSVFQDRSLWNFGAWFYRKPIRTRSVNCLWCSTNTAILFSASIVLFSKNRG